MCQAWADVCSHFVFKREIIFFFSPPPVVKMKVTIQTWRGENNKPTVFYPGADCCFCQLASLGEPPKSSSLSIFIHWHSAPRQLKVQAQSRQAREGGWVSFFPSFAPLSSRIFFLADRQHHHFNPVEVLVDGAIWRGWNHPSQTCWRGTSTFVIQRSWSQPRVCGSVLGCCDAVVELTGLLWVGEMVTVRGCRQDPWFKQQNGYFFDQVKVRNAKAAISGLSPATDDQKSGTTRSRTHIIYNLSVYRKTHLMSCCAINVSTTGSPKSDKMLCLFFNSLLFT